MEQARRLYRDIFRFFFIMKVCHFEAILMSTHIFPFSILKLKITQDCTKSAAMGFSQGTYDRVRNSRGKRAISVRATEVLLYICGTNPLCIYPGSAFKTVLFFSVLRVVGRVPSHGLCHV